MKKNDCCSQIMENYKHPEHFSLQFVISFYPMKKLKGFFNTRPCLATCVWNVFNLTLVIIRVSEWFNVPITLFWWTFWSNDCEWACLFRSCPIKWAFSNKACGGENEFIIFYSVSFISIRKPSNILWIDVSILASIPMLNVGII